MVKEPTSRYLSELRWPQALQLLSLMRRRPPNLVSFGSAISACAKGAQWPRSLILMEQLRRQYLQPNSVVLSACMDACASGREWIHALRLMQSSDAPNLAMFNTLLHGLAANSQWLQVLEMFKLQQVQSGDDRVLQVAYCAILVACAISAQWRQALNFLHRMRRASLPIQLPAWHAVQSSLASTWRWQQALQILTEITAHEVQPDVVNYLTVADACTRGGRPERFLSQLPAMRGRALSTLLWRRKGIGGEEPPSDIAFSGLAVELLRVSSGSDQRKGNLQRLHDSKQTEVRYWSCPSRAGSWKGRADHIFGSFTTSEILNSQKLVSMASAIPKKPGGRPKQSSTEVLDITGLHLEWDSNPEIRNRLRDGGCLLEGKAAEDIPSAITNVGVLQPLVTRMSLTQTRPLPAVEALRDEVETIYLRNKRGSAPEDSPDIVGLAWKIRKLLVFLKMKVPAFQQLCLELDGSLEDDKTEDEESGDGEERTERNRILRKILCWKILGFLLCLLLGLGKRQPPSLLPDQVETQPIDLRTVDPPPDPEPSVVLSPDVSAEDKRAVYQSNQKGLVPDKTRDFSKAKGPVKSKSIPQQKQKEDFTESDEEAGAFCQIGQCIQKKLNMLQDVAVCISFMGFKVQVCHLNCCVFPMAGRAQRSGNYEEGPLTLKQKKKDSEPRNDDEPAATRGRGVGRGRGKERGKGRGRCARDEDGSQDRPKSKDGNAKNKEHENKKRNPKPKSRNKAQKPWKEDEGWAAWGSDGAWSQGWGNDGWDWQGWAWDSYAWWDKQASLNSLNEQAKPASTSTAEPSGPSSSKKAPGPKAAPKKRTSKGASKKAEVEEGKDPGEDGKEESKSKKRKATEAAVKDEKELEDGEPQEGGNKRRVKRKGKKQKKRALPQHEVETPAEAETSADTPTGVHQNHPRDAADDHDVVQSDVLPNSKALRLGVLLASMKNMHDLNIDDGEALERVKENLPELKACRLNIYWSRPAVGLTCKAEKKDFSYFRQGDKGYSSVMRLIAMLKAAEMVALFVDELTERDGFDPNEKITENAEVNRLYAEMKEIATDAVQLVEKASEAEQPVAGSATAPWLKASDEEVKASMAKKDKAQPESQSKEPSQKPEETVPEGMTRRKAIAQFVAQLKILVSKKQLVELTITEGWFSEDEMKTDLKSIEKLKKEIGNLDTQFDGCQDVWSKGEAEGFFTENQKRFFEKTRTDDKPRTTQKKDKKEKDKKEKKDTEGSKRKTPEGESKKPKKLKKRRTSN
eukprot:s151_g52.t2